MELTNNQRTNIIHLIKTHIKEKGNCRVGWAIKNIAGNEFGESVHNIEKIANTLIQSGRYIKEPSGVQENDWNIFVNPQYKLYRFNKTTVIINILLTIIVILLTLFG